VIEFFIADFLIWKIVILVFKVEVEQRL